MMAKTEIEIISLLISRNDYTSFRDLSLTFNASERKIRYDVDKANELLKQLDFPAIEQNRGWGVKLNCTEQQRENLNTFLSKYNNNMNYYTSDERFLIIIFRILNNQMNVFGNGLAEDLMVSKSTIDSDIKKIREYIKCFHLSIVSIPKQGFQFVGEEWFIRLMLNNLTARYLNADKIISYCKDQLVGAKEEMIILEFLDRDIIAWIYELINKLNQLEDIVINEVYSKQIAIMFAIWYQRILQGQYLQHTEFDIHFDEKTHIHELISLFAASLKEKYRISVSPYERYYLCYLMDVFNLKKKINLKRNWGGVQMITLQFLGSMEQQMGVPFTKDSELFERLYQHMEALLGRLRKKISISNPLNSMIVEQYFEMYNAVKKAAVIIEKYSGEKLSDDEITYITIYFSSSKEKLTKQYSIQYRVVVVCGYGIATGEILAENLKKRYQLDVIGIVNSYDLQAIKRLNADFAFTTMDIAIPNLPTLRVNPFLTDYDQNKINQFMKKHSPVRMNNISNLNGTKFFGEICEIVQSSSPQINMGNFVEKLTGLFEKNRLIIDKKGVQPMISDVLKDNQIILNKEIENWETAIWEVAKPLQQDGYIEASYIKAMIDSVHQYGAYIVINKGIALAHARPEDGVNKLGLSIMTFKNPVDFGSQDHDPVRIIFCLAAVDNYSHLKMLKTIVNIISEEWKLEKMIQQTTIEAFKEVLLEFEED